MSGSLRRLWYRVSRRIQDSAPVLWTRWVYWRTLGLPLNLKSPQDFNEKLQWLKLFSPDPQYPRLADKIAVRQEVEERGYGHLLPRLWGTWDLASQVPWDQFPDRFAVKCNHGSGFNLFCTDPKTFSREAAEATLARWLATDYSRFLGEWHYAPIVPRIFVEEFLEDGQGTLPKDFKVYCFDGVPACILVVKDRGEGIHYDLVDTDWKPLGFLLERHRSPSLEPRPNQLPALLEAASGLSRGFPFVRVDFYLIGERLVFGELTFYPSAGLEEYTPEGLLWLAERLVLPPKKNRPWGRLRYVASKGTGQPS